MVSFSPHYRPSGDGEPARGSETPRVCFHRGCAQRGVCVPGERTTCCDPRVRQTLLPYALTCCPEDEALAFEAHLLDCEVCYRDLKALDRAGAVIRQIAEIEPPRREGAR